MGMAPSPRLLGLESGNDGGHTFGMSHACGLSGLLGSGSKACRVRVAVGGGSTSIVKFRLFGSGNRRIRVCCGLTRGAFAVSHAGDNRIAFDGSFPTIAITPIRNNGRVGVHLFMSGSDVRTFNGSKHFTVAGLMFPSRPCGHVDFCTGNKDYGIASFAICGLKLGWRVVVFDVRGAGGSSLTGLFPIVLYFFTVNFISLINVTSGCIGTSLGLASSRTGVFPSLIFF